MKAELKFDDTYSLELDGKQVMIIMKALEQFFPIKNMPGQLTDDLNEYLKKGQLHDREFFNKVNDAQKIVTAFNQLLIGRGYVTIDGSDLLNYDDFVAYNRTLPKDKRFNLGKDSE